MEFFIRQNMHIQMYASEYPQGYYAMEFHLMILKHFVLIWMLRWSAIWFQLWSTKNYRKALLLQYNGHVLLLLLLLLHWFKMSWKCASLHLVFLALHNIWFSYTTLSSRLIPSNYILFSFAILPFNNAEHKHANGHKPWRLIQLYLLAIRENCMNKRSYFWCGLVYWLYLQFVHYKQVQVFTFYATHSLYLCLVYTLNQIMIQTNISWVFYRDTTHPRIFMWSKRPCRMHLFTNFIKNRSNVCLFQVFCRFGHYIVSIDEITMIRWCSHFQ